MDIRQQLARDEGHSLIPYPDSKGWMTIGIGHWLGVKTLEEVPLCFRNGITEQQCIDLFNADETHVEHLLDVYIPQWHTLDGGNSPGPRASVLINMGFNLGVPGLAAFHQFLDLMLHQKWDAAAADLLTTKVSHGLPNRYTRLAQQIRTGVWV
jgi:GH24 family phage-related lysozyme (muramidase)